MGQIVHHHRDIAIGKIIRLEQKGVFEGYALLLEPDGVGLTQRGSDGGHIVVKQRWLIEWARIEKIGEILSPAERITQITLKSCRTHRTLLYLSKNQKQDSYTTSNTSYAKESDFDLDDNYRGMF